MAMSDPLLFSLVQDLEFHTGYRIKQVVATRTDILNAIETGYRGLRAAGVRIGRVRCRRVIGCLTGGHKLNAGCGNRGRALQSGWNFCRFVTRGRSGEDLKKEAARQVTDRDACLERAPFKSH